jgi:hypothetical protein
MRARNLQIATLFAVLTAAPALGDTTGGSAAPVPHLAPVTEQEIKDPNIGSPQEVGVDCISGDFTAAESGDFKEAHVHPGKSCLPQKDSFKRAAEAASFLAFYQQNFSQYGLESKDPVRKQEIQDALKACIGNDPKCFEGDNGRKMKGDLLKALVQHNFGKELKASVLENQTRAENMKSMDMYVKVDKTAGPGGIPTKVLNWNNSLHVGQVTKQSFRLDPKTVVPYDASKVSAQERVKLGQEFNNNFNSFVNEYTSSTGQRGPKSRWHYVEAKSAALGANATVIVAYNNSNLDARQGKAAIDVAALNSDVKSQETADVKDIVAIYRDHFKDVLAMPTEGVKVNQGDGKFKVDPTDSMKAAYEATGFGLDREQLESVKGTQFSPKEVADLVVMNINRQITAAEKTIDDRNKLAMARVPSSAPNGAKQIITPSVTVDMKAFDTFLNDIWPGGPKDAPVAN